MAVFVRPGHENILSNFGFAAFIEDFFRTSEANGCKNKRSADFFSPSIHYKEDGQNQKLVFTSAIFTKDQNDRPMDTVCKDWTCARATNNSFFLETGGSGEGPAPKLCPNNMRIHLGNKIHNRRVVLKPLRFCNIRSK